MRGKYSKRLVIDTDVIRAAGDIHATKPRAINCRDFLKEVLVKNLSVVLTKEIKDEWKKHSSSFALEWRYSMYARRKVVDINPPQDDALQDKIIGSTDVVAEINAMKKDMHLLHAAMATDNSIISCDESVRTFYAKASQQVGEIRMVIWVNPDRTEEEPIVWLKNGAPPENHRLLSTYFV